MALSRNLGHAGSTAALQTLQSDASRHVCTRWEHLLASSFLASHSTWHQNAALAIEKSIVAIEPPDNTDTDNGIIALELHSISGDASNASVVQSKKTHACRVHSVYTVFSNPKGSVEEGGQDGLEGGRVWMRWSRIQFADVQLLPEMVNAAVINNMYVKQMQSISASRSSAPWDS